MTYVCQTCRMNFLSEKLLKKHEKTKLHVETLKSQGKHRFFCELCQYGTNVKCNYKSHVSSKRHLNILRKFEHEELHHCDVCDISSRDKQNFERHLKTKQHKYLFDKTLDMPREKLDKIIGELVTYISESAELVPGEVFKEKKRILKPPGASSYYATGEKYLIWMKSMLSPIHHRFSLEGNECRFFWPSHRYILSKRDFAYMVVSVSSKVFEKKIFKACEEAKKLNVNRACEKHERPRNCCHNCLLETVVDMGKYEKEAYEKIMSEKLWTIMDGTKTSRIFCFGYCQWWFDEQKYSSEFERCLGERLIFGNELLGREHVSFKEMSDIEFLGYLKLAKCKSARKPSNDRMSTAIFFRKLMEFITPSNTTTSGAETERADITKNMYEALFYSSFCEKAHCITDNIFAAQFGFERELAISTKAKEIISNLWSCENNYS